MELMIPSRDSVAGFPISSYGTTSEYSIAYLLQHQNTQLMATINDITIEDIEPEKILQFMQEKGVISNASEWRMEKMDDSSGDTTDDDLYMTIIFRRQIAA